MGANMSAVKVLGVLLALGLCTACPRRTPPLPPEVDIAGPADGAADVGDTESGDGATTDGEADTFDPDETGDEDTQPPLQDALSDDVVVTDVLPKEVTVNCPWQPVPMPIAVTEFACEAWPWPEKIGKKSFYGRNAHRFASGALLVLRPQDEAWFVAPGGACPEVLTSLHWSDFTLARGANGSAALLKKSKGGKNELFRWNAIGKLIFQGTTTAVWCALDGKGTLYEAGVLTPGKMEITARLENGTVAWTASLGGLEELLAVPGGGVIAAYLQDGKTRFRRFGSSGALLHDGPWSNPLLKSYKPGYTGYTELRADAEGGILGISRSLSYDAAFRIGPQGDLRWIQALLARSGLLARQNEFIYDHDMAGGLGFQGYSRFQYGTSENEDFSMIAFLRTWDLDGRPGYMTVEPNPKGLYENYHSLMPTLDGGFLALSQVGVRRHNARGSAVCGSCATTGSSCDDADPCTVDSCSAQLGDCVHTAVPGCKKSLGTCIVQADCDDGDPCTKDVCDAKTGGCKHTGQKLCQTDNTCIGDDDGNGKCVDGKCVVKPEANCKSQASKDAPTDGWVLGLDGQRPEVFEAKQGDLLIAGGWIAMRVQANGVVRWRRVLDGGIGAVAPGPDDGLLAVILQPKATAKPGWTRFARVTAGGKVQAGSTVATGLDDWWLKDSMEERQRWLVARPDGGHVLLGQKAWAPDIWQGRMVVLGADGQVTLAADVTLTGLGAGADQPGARGIDHVWPASDGGLLVAWHGTTAAGGETHGATRIGGDVKVVWQQSLAGAQTVAFDPWRPRGLAKYKNDTILHSFVVTAAGIGPTQPSAIGEVTEEAAPKGPNPPPIYKKLVRYAEAPGVFAAADLGHGPVAKNWPAHGPMAWSMQGFYNYLFAHGGHLGQTQWVTSAGRVVTLAYGIGSYPTLVLRGVDGQFRLCVKNLSFMNPGGGCSKFNWPCEYDCFYEKCP